MTTPHASTKATIPSPLPHHRGVLCLSEPLKTSITGALFASHGAIPNIQTAMRESLTRPSGTDTIAASVSSKQALTRKADEASSHGYMGALGTWLANEFSTPGAEEMGDEVMLRRLMDAVRAGRSSGAGRVGGEKECGVNPGTALEVPEQAVEEIVKAVRKELEKCCVVVDGEEWVG